MTTDPEGNKNVFQLWKEGGERLPFKVIRWTWNPATSTFLVERIEIGKWPYGKAWGRFIRNGVPEVPQQLSGAGSYQWKVVGSAAAWSTTALAVIFRPYAASLSRSSAR